MSDHTDPESADQVPGRPREQDYEVGYRKPPRHSQFKKGQSGNPKGTKTPQSLGEAALEICQSKIRITVNGKSQRVSLEKAALMGIAKKAISGDAKAIKTLFDLRNSAPPPQDGPTVEEEEEDTMRALSLMEPDELDALMKFNRTRMELGEQRRKKAKS